MSIFDIERMIDNLGVTIIEQPLNGNLLGFYDDEHHVIYIDSRLNPTQYRCTLCHEFWHASFHDTISCIDHYNNKDEIRTRRMTANTLIKLDEYKLAEQTYGNQIKTLAIELGVTQAVIKDYQKYILQTRIG